MPRIETRLTSVQVVSGFAASFIIPNPPGWSSSPSIGCPEVAEPISLSSTSSTGIASNPQPNPGCRERQPVSVKLEDVEIIPPVDDQNATKRPQLALEPPTIPIVREPVDTRTYEPQEAFKHLKLSGEAVYVNYLLRRGDWMNDPPANLDFTSCKPGPRLYVNDVEGKNVTQAWWWKCEKWVSVKEGDVFFTERERVLELDRNRIPRLRAVRKRGGS